MKYVDINVLAIMEDMSCNTGMLVSPTMFREFMMLYYKQLIKHGKQYQSTFGVWVDSDGDVSQSKRVDILFLSIILLRQTYRWKTTSTF